MRTHDAKRVPYRTGSPTACGPVRVLRFRLDGERNARNWRTLPYARRTLARGRFTASIVCG